MSPEMGQDRPPNRDITGLHQMTPVSASLVCLPRTARQPRPALGRSARRLPRAFVALALNPADASLSLANDFRTFANRSLSLAAPSRTLAIHSLNLANHFLSLATYPLALANRSLRLASRSRSLDQSLHFLRNPQFHNYLQSSAPVTPGRAPGNGHSTASSQPKPES